MDDKFVWDLYFASIASLRFHPRNDGNNTPSQDVAFAARVADMMLEERNNRWPGLQQQQQ